MSRRLVVAPALRIASVTAALAACSVAQASVQTVFSAENALYGAGYNIGEADGWIDDNLRSAIRQFQADRPGLNTTGELDSPTLSALGITEGRSTLVGGNSVASREAARKELGLSVAAASAPKVARSAPEPEPVREKQVAQPEPVPEPAPVEKAEKVAEVEKVEKIEEKVAEVSAPQPAVQPAPEPVSQPEPQVAQSEPEPTSEPIRVVPKVRASESERSSPVADSNTAELPDEAVTVASAGNPEDVKAALPQEPAAQGTEQAPVNTATGAETQPNERQGNVLTRMFDFLFGWMV